MDSINKENIISGIIGGVAALALLWTSRKLLHRQRKG
jgi:hypothetical protein